MTYALDTNTVIHLIVGTDSVYTRFDEGLSQSDVFVIPPYVDFEVRRGLLYSNATAKERTYHNICVSCDIGEMNRGIWLRAAGLYSDLRRKSFTVGDADILIAAFCLEHGYTLVTNNTKDFINIDGLVLVDWLA